MYGFTFRVELVAGRTTCEDLEKRGKECGVEILKVIGSIGIEILVEIKNIKTRTVDLILGHNFLRVACTAF